MDITTVSAALGSFSALKDVAQSMIGLRDAAAFQGKLIEFQGKLLEAQASVFVVNDERTLLLEEISKLEKKRWLSSKHGKLRNSGTIWWRLRPDRLPTP